MSLSENNQSGIGRRVFLKLAGTLGIIIGLPSAARAFFLKKFPVRTVDDDRWSFDPQTGILASPSGDREEYRLAVDGMVNKKVSLTYAEIKSLPQGERVLDFHCVEGWSVADVKWGGFRFEEIVKLAGPLPEATHVVFHSLGHTRHKPEGLDHYVESFPLSRLTDPKADILMVLDMDGRPLSHEHGAPLRVFSPYDLGYKSIKFVAKIEFTEKPAPGWWTRANPIYPIEAPVPEHRLRKK
jgi:DMSO/TMAO reductase YedYZ molybdopterin-dependent catalytic subunit